MASGTVYAADKLTVGKAVTQTEVVDAVAETVETSVWTIKLYSRAHYGWSERHLEPTGAVGRLVMSD